MVRPQRVEYEGAYYHVMNRGQGRQNVYHGERYYEYFLDCLGQAHKGHKGSPIRLFSSSPRTNIIPNKWAVKLVSYNCFVTVFSSVVIVTLSRNSHPSGSNAILLRSGLPLQKDISTTQVSAQFDKIRGSSSNLLRFIV